MVLKDVVINNVPQTLTQFKDIKLYGYLLSYHGYGLLAKEGNIANGCVLNYMLDKLNNPNETNRKKRIMKLNKDTLMLELGMTAEDEGCSLAQLIVFLDNHKITYYAVDYRFFTVDHNKDKEYSRMTNFPVLYFMIAGNHLYPIEGQPTHMSISQIN